jgi:hypothetical protein
MRFNNRAEICTLRSQIYSFSITLYFWLYLPNAEMILDLEVNEVEVKMLTSLASVTWITVRTVPSLIAFLQIILRLEKNPRQGSQPAPTQTSNTQSITRSIDLRKVKIRTQKSWLPTNIISRIKNAEVRAPGFSHLASNPGG